MALLNLLKRWWKTVVMVFLGVLMILAGRKATKLHERAKAKDEAATELLNSGISKQLQKGKALIDSADKDKDKAVAAKKAMKEHLEVLGQNDESIDDIATRFNSRRVRERTGSSS